MQRIFFCEFFGMNFLLLLTVRGRRGVLPPEQGLRGFKEMRTLNHNVYEANEQKKNSILRYGKV